MLGGLRIDDVIQTEAISVERRRIRKTGIELRQPRAELRTVRHRKGVQENFELSSSEVLEGQFQRKLDVPRKIVARTVYRSECRGAEGSDGKAEIRCVRQIERFSPELQLHPLVDSEVLEDGQVQSG